MNKGLKTTKKKTGPKKKILNDKKTLDAIVELGSQGLTTGQIARCLGVSWSTLDRRRKEHEEIEDAIKKGEALGVSRVANALYESATIDKNVTAQIFYLKNRSENWSDRQEVNHNLDLAGILSNAHGRIIDARTDESESLQLTQNYARTETQQGDQIESLGERAENKTGQTTTDDKQSGGV